MFLRLLISPATTQKMHTETCARTLVKRRPQAPNISTAGTVPSTSLSTPMTPSTQLDQIECYLGGGLRDKRISQK